MRNIDKAERNKVRRQNHTGMGPVPGLEAYEAQTDESDEE
jgi:hypothetical protein